jgi:hypothetical protein
MSGVIHLLPIRLHGVADDSFTSLPSFETLNTCLKQQIIFPIFRLYAVAQLVEELRHNPGGRGFDFRLGTWDFSLT